MIMLRAPYFALLAAGLVLSNGPATAQTQTLRVSAIPDENPTELLRKFKPLGAYLENETGMKVIWTP
jgi:phosphonate transport system substrate-binding protein